MGFPQADLLVGFLFFQVNLALSLNFGFFGFLIVLGHGNARFLFNFGFLFLHDIGNHLLAFGIADVHQFNVLDGLNPPRLQFFLNLIGKLLTVFGAFTHNFVQKVFCQNGTNRTLDNAEKLFFQLVCPADARGGNLIIRNTEKRLNINDKRNPFFVKSFVVVNVNTED